MLILYFRRLVSQYPTYTAFFVLKNSSSKNSFKSHSVVLFLTGMVSFPNSPPLRQISPLGNAFCCLGEMFLRIIFSRSVSGITARLTTKSNFPFSSSARAWRKVTFFSPILLAISEATRTFFPMLSTRWNCTSGKRMASGIPGKLLPCRGP